MTIENGITELPQPGGVVEDRRTAIQRPGCAGGWWSILFLLGVAVVATLPGWWPGRVLAPTDALMGTPLWNGSGVKVQSGWDGLRLERAAGAVARLAFTVECLRRWDIPLWNPYDQLGQPFGAAGKTAPFFPTTWLHVFLPPTWSWTVVAALLLFVAGVGAWRLAVRAILMACDQDDRQECLSEGGQECPPHRAAMPVRWQPGMSAPPEGMLSDGGQECPPHHQECPSEGGQECPPHQIPPHQMETGRTLAPACVAGVAYMLCGFVLGGLSDTSLNVLALLPWALLAVERLIEKRSAWRMVGLIVILALQMLGGDAAASGALVLTCIVVYLLHLLFFNRLGALAALFPLLLCAMIAAAMAGPQLLPMIEYARHAAGARATASNDFVDHMLKGDQLMPWIMPVATVILAVFAVRLGRRVGTDLASGKSMAGFGQVSTP
ncbi:MAG TPA: hypothetical protein VIL86_15560, partial [Tepidisphaeraceae bacterium]